MSEELRRRLLAGYSLRKLRLVRWELVRDLRVAQQHLHGLEMEFRAVDAALSLHSTSREKD